MIDLPKLIEQANDLQPLPASTVRLAWVAANPDCDLSEIVQPVEFDQVLTLKMLRAANSVFSASETPVGNVHEAVLRMGTVQVLAFAVGASTRPYLQGPVPGYGMAEGALWRHSVAAAAAMETMGSCGIAVPPNAVTAALLHDIGKLVLNRFLSQEILGFIQRARTADGLTLVEAESQLLGVNHAELGGLIAQHWKLPPEVVSGITWHHFPDQGGEPICDLTCAANQIAKHIEATLDGGKFTLEVPPGVAERLSLAPPTLEYLCLAAMSRYLDVSRQYNAA